jgi:hypothetical protein
LEEAQRLGQGGELDPLLYSKGHAMMCTSSAWWGEQLAQIGQRLARDCGANALYLDVSANCAPLLCFDPTHGHPPGGGHWWVDGQIAQIERIKAAPDGIRLISSECFNEAYGAALDQFLVWTDRMPWAAPLLGSVYGGWIPWHGSRVYRSGDDEAGFTAKLARDVFWGGAVGTIINEWIAAPESERLALIVKSLVDLRRRGKEYLVYGEMIRPPDWAVPPPHTVIHWYTERHGRSVPMEVEAIDRAAWQARDGSVAVALINYDSEPHPAALNLHRPPAFAARPTWTLLTPEGEGPAQVVPEDGIVRVELPPRRPCLVVFPGK